MVNFIGGLQGLAVAVAGIIGFSHLTGAGTFASIIFGGLVSMTIMGGLFLYLPRLMILAGTIFWTGAGYSLGNSIFTDLGSAIAAALVLGGIGAAANYGLILEARHSFVQGEQFGEALLPARLRQSSGKDRENVLLLHQSIQSLDAIGALDRALFIRLDKTCSAYAQGAGVNLTQAGAVGSQSVRETEALDSLTLLEQADLLSEAEAKAVFDRIARWAERPVALPGPR